MSVGSFSQVRRSPWRRGQVVRQRPAKPLSPVRIRSSPPETPSGPGDPGPLLSPRLGVSPALLVGLLPHLGLSPRLGLSPTCGRNSILFVYGKGRRTNKMEFLPQVSGDHKFLPNETGPGSLPDFRALSRRERMPLGMEAGHSAGQPYQTRFAVVLPRGETSGTIPILSLDVYSFQKIILTCTFSGSPPTDHPSPPESPESSESSESPSSPESPSSSAYVSSEVVSPSSSAYICSSAYSTARFMSTL